MKYILRNILKSEENTDYKILKKNLDLGNIWRYSKKTRMLDAIINDKNLSKLISWPWRIQEKRLSLTAWQ